MPIDDDNKRMPARDSELAEDCHHQQTMGSRAAELDVAESSSL